jgi:dephospho-CoA kinase
MREMRELTEEIDKHVRQMAPHINERKTAKLLIAANKEIKSLKMKVSRLIDKYEPPSNPR